MAKKNTSKTAVDNVTTLAQLAANKLDRAVQGLEKVSEDLKKSSDEQREIIESIEVKQGELAQLELDYQEKERQLKLDLQMRAKEEAESLVYEILNAKGHTSIDNTELRSLKQELETIKNDFDKNVKAEVAKTVSIISERHDSAMKGKELEFKAETATINAQLQTANEKAESLGAQLEEYKDIITEERKARVEESKARGGERVNITNTK